MSKPSPTGGPQLAYLQGPVPVTGGSGFLGATCSAPCLRRAPR
jgi:hypothetical protein